jgi:hypothetical protein
MQLKSVQIIYQFENINKPVLDKESVGIVVCPSSSRCLTVRDGHRSVQMTSRAACTKYG